MRFWLTIVVLSILFTPFVLGQKRVDEFSESGESLTIPDAVRFTTDGVKKLHLFDDKESAKQLFEEAIASDSTYAPAFYSLANIYMYNSADTAYYYAKRAYQLDTMNTKYLSSYAQTTTMVERFDEARALYDRLLKLEPRDVNAYRILAIIYNQQKEPLKAVELLNSAEVCVGKNPYLLDLKRQILLSNNQTDQLLEDAKKSVEEDPSSVEERVTLAELYRDLKRDSLALNEYHNAIKLDSTKLETLYSLGDFLNDRNDKRGYIDVVRLIIRSDQLEEKSKISLVENIISDRELYRREYIAVGGLLTSLIVQYPNNETIIDMQAKHLIAMNMLDEALSMMKNHLDIEPPSLKVYRSVIDIERYKGRLDSVELYLNQAIEKFPDDEDLKLEWGFTLSSQGHFDEAINHYSKQLEGANDSISSSIWGVIGDLHHQVAISDSTDVKLFKKRMKQSYKAYDNSLSFSPDNAMVLNNYAYFLCEYGKDLERALIMSEHATQLFEGNSTFIDTYAWILYKLGRYDEAKVNMRRAISFDTTQNGEIALHYGEILAALDETTMANYYWGKALEWGMSKDQIETSRKAAAELAIKRAGKSKKQE